MLRPLLLLAAICVGASAETAFALPEPLCVGLDYARRAEVDCGGTDPATITVRTLPEKRFTARLRPFDGRRLELRIQARAAGEGTLELLAADGRVLAKRRLLPVEVTTDSGRHISTVGKAEDGADIFTGKLFLTPLVPGLDVRFACLAPDVLVPDGLNERWIASETFVPAADGASGGTGFRMHRAPGGRYVPFTYIIYQDGEQITAP